MEFERNCDNGSGPSNCKSMKVFKTKWWVLLLLQWFNQNLAEATSESGPMCAQKTKFLHEAF
jgi:hypothetical protein